MAIIAYSKQNEYDLVNSNQDCLGWRVVDQAGNIIGQVTEINIDTDAEMVSAIIVDNAKQIPVSDFVLQNHQVIIRGVMHSEEYESTQNAAITPTIARQNSDQTISAETDAMKNAVTNPENTAEIKGAANQTETVLPIIEEQIKLDKRTVETGEAKVRTNIIERPVEQTVNLREELVTVDRRPVDRPVGNAPNAFQEGIIEVFETAEVPIVSKEARVIEEVVVGKNVTERQETIRDTVKRTEVDINQLNRDGAVNRQSD